MRTPIVRPALLGLICLSCGCNWFLPLAFILPDTKTVPAEFAGLAEKTALVVVWAEPETQYDYLHIRLELSSFIGDKILAEVDKVHVIDAREVEDYIERTPEAAYSPRMVGEQFMVDMVVYVELLEFQVRDPTAPDFLQGKVRASVGVHDLTGDADEGQYFELEQVAVIHPDQPELFTPQAPLVVRNQTYAKFAEAVARKFYDHKEKL
ncbi:MAG: hypothetical protein GY778_05540 [bacterium]|nr:hypothetical protein [bacterium]